MVVEGCIGETVATSLAEAALAVAVDDEATRALSRIAKDEADHATLAWRFVAWAIERGGADVAVAVRDAFAQMLAPRRVAEVRSPDLDIATLHHNGRLTPGEKAAAHARALENVVRPCAEALLSSLPSPPSLPRVHAVGV